MKKLDLQLHEQSCGRSMVEMLGVLAIIGVLSVGGIAGYSKAMMKHKINKTTDQLSQIVANIRTAFSSQGSYSGLSISTIKSLGLAPEDMYTDSDDTLKNAFGGNVHFETELSTLSVNTKNTFLIGYEGLPTEACIALATADWGSDQDGLIAVGAGTSDVFFDTEYIFIDNPDDSIVIPSDGYHASVASPYSTVNPTPMSVSYATKACSESGSNNSIALKFM